MDYRTRTSRVVLTHVLYALLVSLCLLDISCGKVGFVKDQGLDVQFPPSIHKSDLGIPDGHLRPLGWQRRPEGKVTEVKKMLTAKELYNKYVMPGKPVVFRKVLADDPVLKKWEDRYLKETYGKLNVTVAVKNPKQPREPQIMKFKKFILDYMYEDWHLAATVPGEMAAELPLPSCLSCGSFREYLYESELWMSSGGTASSLHSHEDHNMHCVLFGRKDFIVIESKYQEAFEFKENYPNAGAGASPLDMDMLNMYKYTDIATVPWKWSTLMPGDCLLVPAGYLHQVRAYSRSISFTSLFVPTLKFDDARCPKKPLQLRLSNVQFLWTSQNGQRKLSETQVTGFSLRFILKLLLRQKEKLHFQQFEHFYNEVMEIATDQPTAREVFDILTSPEDRSDITRKEVEALDELTLEAVAVLMREALPQEKIKHRDEL